MSYFSSSWFLRMKFGNDNFSKALRLFFASPDIHVNISQHHPYTKILSTQVVGQTGNIFYNNPRNSIMILHCDWEKSLHGYFKGLLYSTILYYNNNCESRELLCHSQRRIFHWALRSQATPSFEPQNILYHFWDWIINLKTPFASS